MNAMSWGNRAVCRHTCVARPKKASAVSPAGFDRGSAAPYQSQVSTRVSTGNQSRVRCKWICCRHLDYVAAVNNVPSHDASVTAVTAPAGEWGRARTGGEPPMAYTGQAGDQPDHGIVSWRHLGAGKQDVRASISRTFVARGQLIGLGRRRDPIVADGIASVSVVAVLPHLEPHLFDTPIAPPAPSLKQREACGSVAARP